MISNGTGSGSGANSGGPHSLTRMSIESWNSATVSSTASRSCLVSAGSLACLLASPVGSRALAVQKEDLIYLSSAADFIAFPSLEESLTEGGGNCRADIVALV